MGSSINKYARLFLIGMAISILMLLLSGCSGSKREVQPESIKSVAARAIQDPVVPTPQAPAKLAPSLAQSRSLPAPASVDAVMSSFKRLERTISLCIIKGAPAGSGMSNSMNVADLERDIARSQKEMAFLKGIRSADVEKAVMDKATAYLQRPTDETAYEFRTTLNLFIQLARSDIRADTWIAVVPAAHTAQADIQIDELELLAGRM